MSKKLALSIIDEAIEQIREYGRKDGEQLIENLKQVGDAINNNEELN